MTAKLVDDITDTHSNKTRESVGQTMINVRNGARTRISTFLAGAFLMVLCVVFGPVVSDIPVAALVAVVVLVSVGTFDRRSVAPAALKRMSLGETMVIFARRRAGRLPRHR
ncbi:SulP family inorganic anion transporter [Actinomadura kijaniata]|uniref:SulP family inorganic anion transporter n=1 Tax=Actinomadura kijaniata TaxID=46161 RepID=UPI001FDF96D7|nr:SulP family inorganic anion transporter [Actinomadura kijaniata]